MANDRDIWAEIFRMQDRIATVEALGNQIKGSLATLRTIGVASLLTLVASLVLVILRWAGVVK